MTSITTSPISTTAPKNNNETKVKIIKTNVHRKAFDYDQRKNLPTCILNEIFKWTGISLSSIKIEYQYIKNKLKIKDFGHQSQEEVARRYTMGKKIIKADSKANQCHKLESGKKLPETEEISDFCRGMLLSYLIALCSALQDGKDYEELERKMVDVFESLLNRTDQDFLALFEKNRERLNENIILVRDILYFMSTEYNSGDAKKLIKRMENFIKITNITMELGDALYKELSNNKKYSSSYEFLLKLEDKDLSPEVKEKVENFMKQNFSEDEYEENDFYKKFMENFEIKEDENKIKGLLNFILWKNLFLALMSPGIDRDVHGRFDELMGELAKKVDFF